MDLLINRLEFNNYKYYCTGIYRDNTFFECSPPFKINSLKIQIKKDYEKNILKLFVPFFLKEIHRSAYEVIYSVGKNLYLYFEFVVDSHVIVPAVLLRDFCDSDTKLYYIDTEKDIIKWGSARKYNTKFGHYTLKFEHFLRDNYECKIGKVKAIIKDFIFNKKDQVHFVGLYDIVKNFLNMSFFRNPKFIEKINKDSFTSSFLQNGYSSESVAFFYNKFGTNVMENMSIYLVENRTDEGFVLSDEIFSNIIIKSEKDVAGMILPLHPKFGFIIVPTEYYKKQNLIYSDESFMIINDVKILRSINERIYYDCKRLGINVIGQKKDLDIILSTKKE